MLKTSISDQHQVTFCAKGIFYSNVKNWEWFILKCGKILCWIILSVLSAFIAVPICYSFVNLVYEKHFYEVQWPDIWCILLIIPIVLLVALINLRTEDYRLPCSVQMLAEKDGLTVTYQTEQITKVEISRIKLFIPRGQLQDVFFDRYGVLVIQGKGDLSVGKTLHKMRQATRLQHLRLLGLNNKCIFAIDERQALQMATEIQSFMC